MFIGGRELNIKGKSLFTTQERTQHLRRNKHKKWEYDETFTSVLDLCFGTEIMFLLYRFIVALLLSGHLVNFYLVTA